MLYIFNYPKINLFIKILKSRILFLYPGKPFSPSGVYSGIQTVSLSLTKCICILTRK